MTLQHHFIEVQGIRTHYVTAGAGDSTVVLLHGGGIDCAELSWGLLLPQMAETHRVVALDWPGYGDSDRPAIAYTGAFYIQFLHAFLDAIAVARASLAGISMGGMIAIGFTLQFPTRVEKLVLVDSYGLQRAAAFHKLSYLFVKAPGVNALTWALMRSRSMIRYTMGALLRRPGSVTPELVEQAYREILRPNSSRAWVSFQNEEITWQGTRTCWMDRLAEIQAPTLILHGSLDGSVPLEDSRQAQARIRGSQLYCLEGCGHWPQRDNPAEFNRVVKEFLARA